MANETIYVVDDEPLITRLAQINLERMGYTVKVAHDGAEALDALQKGELKPDLILLDIMMPYMDGFEMLERLHFDDNLRSIPVVIMTARALDADIIEGHKFGAQQYLTKPINPTELTTVVAEVLKQKREPVPMESQPSGSSDAV